MSLQMSRLKHPYIVPHVESWVQQGHTVNIVCGYCEKGDLESHIVKVCRVAGAEALCFRADSQFSMLPAWASNAAAAYFDMYRSNSLHPTVHAEAKPSQTL